MAAAFKSGEDGSTVWLWVRLGVFVLLAALATELAIVVSQMRILTLGRAPVGWPLAGAYYVTDVTIAPGDVGAAFSSKSHFEFAWGQLAADLALFAAVYLCLFLALRVAWIASKPKPRPLEG